jgi:hypothetical protein
MAAPGKDCVKRPLAAIVAAAILVLSFGVYAQQADKLPRIGVLSNAPLTSTHYEAFRHALRDLGYERVRISRSSQNRRKETPIFSRNSRASLLVPM